MDSRQNKCGYMDEPSIVEDIRTRNANVMEYNWQHEHEPIIWWVNTTCTASGSGTAYLSGAHEFAPVSNEVRVAQSFSFCIVFCRSGWRFVLFLLAIILSVFRLAASTSYFDILKILFDDICFYCIGYLQFLNNLMHLQVVYIGAVVVVIVW